MLDLVIAVDDAEKWHASNIERNPHHYAWYMRSLGARTIANVQRSSFGARLYYNTMMPDGAASRNFKYGVINVNDLIHDLKTWKWLYVAGRTHKPIRILTPIPLSKGLGDALQGNVEYATATALLTLPHKFTEEEAYTAAASLSYIGDIRMVVAAEVASKVPSIVKANVDHFRYMYRGAIDRLGCVNKLSTKLWERDVSPSGQRALLTKLPQQLKTEIKSYMAQTESGFDKLADVLSHKSTAFVSKATVSAVGAIVTRSSIQQSLKGIFTAGAATSVRYVSAKLAKSLAARSVASFSRRFAQINQP